MALWSGPAWANTYYVRTTGNDSNPGTTGSPWLTIQKAANTMVAGDTTIIGDGTYTAGTIFFNTSGSAGNPITLQAEHKRLVILEFNGNLTGTTCQPQLSVSAGYITFQDLRLTVSPSNTRCGTGITSASATGIKFWQQYRAHSPSYPGGCPSGETCNGTTGWVNSQAIGMQVDYHATRGDAIGSQQDGTLVDGCVCYGEIMNYGGLGVIIRNNQILAPGNVGGSFVQSKGESRNTQIYNNVIVMDGSQHGGKGWAGLFLGGDTPQQPSFTGSSVTCWNCVAYNNFVYATGTTAAGDGTNVAWGVQGARNSKMFNNVISGNGKLHLDSISTGNAFYNNIIDGTGQNALLSWANTTTGETIDYNDFYNVTNAPTQTRAISGDPLLANPASDAHLGVGSPAIRAGTTVTMTGYNGETIIVNLDATGALRGVPWNLGIYSSVDVTPPAAPTGVLLQ